MAAPSPILPSVRPAWSALHWTLTFAAVFAFQWFFLVLIGTGSVLTPPPSHRDVRLTLCRPSLAASLLAAGLWKDPTVYSGISDRGFASSALPLSSPMPSIQQDAAEAPAWLDPDPKSLAQRATNLPPSTAILPFLIQNPQAPLVLLHPPPLPVRKQSVWELNGAASKADLLTPIDPPDWPSEKILAVTVVEALIDPHGVTHSVTLLSGSELPEADQWALKTTRSARFTVLRSNSDAPLPARIVRWTFRWATQPSQPKPAANGAKS